MANIGIAPPDFTTPIGQLRSIIGDVVYIDLVPPVTGEGDYTNFSDEQLQSFLSMGGGSNLSYGAGYAYLTLAAQFAADAVKAVSDDLSIDLSSRADQMRKLATEWFTRGDNTSANEANDYFQISYPEYKGDYELYPEGAQRPVIWWY